ncbi:hypothetical protein MMC10_006793 [Thelotrema lepadinum]|nr:hypothetical protein [Thelotrema lepadinum]
MSTIVEPPTSTPSRTRRGKTPRGKDHSKSFKDNVISDVSLTPKPKRRNNSSQAQSYDIPALYDDLVSPLSPPRQASNPIEGSADPSISPTPSKRKINRGRRRTTTKQEENNSTSDSTSRVSRPPTDEEPQGTATPSKSALQMYAGPTFHASPAPSSLPIPKFFAKTTPLSEKFSDTNTTHSDNSSELESSSGNGDESPTLRSSFRIDESHAREPSPLDIFFKADRAEKARLGQHSPLASSAKLIDRAKSASPSTDSFRETQPRQHTRRQTESTATNNSSSSEDIKAKTEALKQLLLLPRAQHSSPAINRRQEPTPFSSEHNITMKPSSSGSSTPSRIFNSSANPNPNRSVSSLCDSPDVPISSSRAPPFHRPLSYHIRQDLHDKLPIDPNESSSKSRYVMPVLP